MLQTESTSRADARMDEAVVDGSLSSVAPPLSDVVLPLRPLRGSEPLDLGLVIFRHAARTLVPLTVLLHVPILTVDLLLRLRWGGGSEGAALAMQGIPVVLLGGDTPYGPFVLVAQSVALSIVGLATGIVLRAALERRSVTTRTVISSSFRRTWTALAITTLSAVLYLLTSCVPFIGLVVAGAATFTASIVAGVEGVGPVRALRRSANLAGSSGMFAAGLFIGGMFVLLLVRFILSLGPFALVAMMGLPDAVSSILLTATGVTLVILQPLTATMAAAAYLALRVRAEGIDLWDRIATIGGSS